MKRNDLFNQISGLRKTKFIVAIADSIDFLQTLWRKHPVSVGIFVSLCLNLVVAPIVSASADNELTRKAAWAIGVLVMVTLGLSLYLFAVIFQPERF